MYTQINFPSFAEKIKSKASSVQILQKKDKPATSFFPRIFYLYVRLVLVVRVHAYGVICIYNSMEDHVRHQN